MLYCIFANSHLSAGSNPSGKDYYFYHRSYCAHFVQIRQNYVSSYDRRCRNPHWVFEHLTKDLIDRTEDTVDRVTFGFVGEFCDLEYETKLYLQVIGFETLGRAFYSASLFSLLVCFDDEKMSV